MQVEEFSKELDILSLAYPRAFPQDSERRSGVFLLWYGHFEYLPLEVFIQASKYCQAHEAFLSIAALRQSLIAAAKVPSEFEIRQQLNKHIEQLSRSEKPGDIHSISKRILKAVGGYQDIRSMDVARRDVIFEREYKRGREWFVTHLLKPENVAHLTESISAPRLVQGKIDRNVNQSQVEALEEA